MSQAAITNPLEAFVRDYVEVAGGLWEQVEPQVYDVLPPPPPPEVSPTPEGATDPSTTDAEQMLRICFDPEALPEHPGSQFCTLGTPLVDQLLHDAQGRGRFARAWLTVANSQPFDIERRIRRAMDLPAGASLSLAATQPTDVVINVFWFAALYDSDQKEQDLLCVAIERQHGREVRHLDQLLADDRLAQAPVQEHPPAALISLISAYDAARRQALRTATAGAGRRLRELHNRIDRQRRRIEHYYDDLLAEIDEGHARAQRLGRDLEKHATRRQHTLQERRVRLAELDRTAALRVNVRLSNLLELHQPKLQLTTRLLGTHGPKVDLPLTWDPLIEAVEPPDCPHCHHPSFAIRIPARTRPTAGRGAADDRAWLCPACNDKSAAR